MTEQQRKIVGLDMAEGQIQRGYITVHTIDENGDEVQMPRDVELTAAQVAAFNAALPGILAAV